MVFTCSWSDWLIEDADAWRDEAYDVIRRTPHLTYQILTKRIERAEGRWSVPPLPNVWLGVSVENRENKHRIDLLREIPAALRFLSIEPLLEDIGELDLRGIAWVIVGGESGPGARLFKLRWAFDILEQCKVANVPLFVKQVGRNSDLVDWMEVRQVDRKGGDILEWPTDLRVRQFPMWPRDAKRVAM